MLKLEVNEKSIEMTMVGDLRRICADLSAAIHAVADRLTENNEELGHQFKVLMTKGFMDGICFQEDREHMERYLDEGDTHLRIRKKDEEKEDESDEFVEWLGGFIDFLKNKRNELEKERKNLDKTKQDADRMIDEALREARKHETE